MSMETTGELIGLGIRKTLTMGLVFIVGMAAHAQLTNPIEHKPAITVSHNVKPIKHKKHKVKKAIYNKKKIIDKPAEPDIKVIVQGLEERVTTLEETVYIERVR